MLPTRVGTCACGSWPKARQTLTSGTSWGPQQLCALLLGVMICAFAFWPSIAPTCLPKTTLECQPQPMHTGRVTNGASAFLAIMAHSGRGRGLGASRHSIWTLSHRHQHAAAQVAMRCSSLSTGWLSQHSACAGRMTAVSSTLLRQVRNHRAAIMPSMRNALTADVNPEVGACAVGSGPGPRLQRLDLNIFVCGMHEMMHAEDTRMDSRPSQLPPTRPRNTRMKLPSHALVGSQSVFLGQVPLIPLWNVKAMSTNVLGERC